MFATQSVVVAHSNPRWPVKRTVSGIAPFSRRQPRIAKQADDAGVEVLQKLWKQMPSAGDRLESIVAKCLGGLSDNPELLQRARREVEATKEHGVAEERGRQMFGSVIIASSSRSVIIDSCLGP